MKLCLAYFINNKNSDRKDLQCILVVKGKCPELWLNERCQAKPLQNCLRYAFGIVTFSLRVALRKCTLIDRGPIRNIGNEAIHRFHAFYVYI